MTREGASHTLARRFLEENRHLLRTLKELGKLLDDGGGANDAAARRASTMAQVLNLQKHLTSLFHIEEGPRGLFEDIQEQRPTEERKLLHLKKEHLRILDQLDQLTTRLQGGGEENLEAIHQDLRPLLAFLYEHESKEARLIQGAYLVDEGGAG
ncbi:MAG: hemerythrin domain-containing protein [Candidatus Tectomicrobia bacterium]|nr:hemerythrin domain-containing protein [Candidatus Tectomicrobia bacterium]